MIDASCFTLFSFIMAYLNTAIYDICEHSDAGTYFLSGLYLYIRWSANAKHSD